MRKIEKREILYWKCEVLGCGSRNHIYSELINTKTGKHVGYMLTCCMCGYHTKFIKDPCDQIADEDGLVKTCGKYCIRNHWCPKYSNKTCKLMNNKYEDYAENSGEAPCMCCHKNDSATCDCLDCPEILCSKNKNPNLLQRSIKVEMNCPNKYR